MLSLLCVIPPQIKGVKALAAHIQQTAEVLDLLLGIEFLQAGAHFAAAVAGVAAEDAPGLVLQRVGGVSMGGEQLRALLLQQGVLRADACKCRGGVLAVAQGLGYNTGHGAPQLPLNFLQPGNLPVDPQSAGRRLRRPALLVLLKPLQRRAHHLAVIRHLSAPLPLQIFLDDLFFALGGWVGPLLLLLNILELPQALLIPPAQDAV